MLTAVEEVRATGTAMSAAAKEFANDPCSSVKRGNMVRASRNLLSAVTRLLILADMIDVHLLLKKLRRVEDDLEYLKSVSSQAELMEGMDRFGKSSADLMTQAAKRQYELKDPVIDFQRLFSISVSVPNSAVQLDYNKRFILVHVLASNSKG
jgi:catenin alpha